MPRITVTALEDDMTVYISRELVDSPPIVEVRKVHGQVAIPLPTLAELVGYTQQYVPRPPDHPLAMAQVDPTRSPRKFRFGCDGFIFRIKLNDAKSDWVHMELEDTTIFTVVRLIFKEYLTLETIVDRREQITALCMDT